MADPASGKVALFDEAPGGGSPSDPTSLRNRPLLDPASWLANVYFHSDLDNLEVVSDTSVAVAHAAVTGTTVSGVSGGGGSGGGAASSGLAASIRYGASSATSSLVTHNLGYVPDFLVVVGNKVLFPGMPAQVQADGRGRYVSAYATTTAITLYEWTSVSDQTLPATNLTYRVIVFRQQRAASGSQLLDFNTATGETTIGKGRFASSRRYLQVVPGGSPFAISYGKTMELRNGAPRIISPDGTVFEPVPAGLKGRWSVTTSSTTHNGAYGSSMAYSGSFIGPTQIQVQAP